MMAKIIDFGANQHRQTQEALPWYVMGQLDESERMQVDAHLAGCATCRHDLQSERDLATDIVSLPLNADVAWAALRPRLRAHRRRSGVLQRAGRALERFARRPNRITWLVAGQVLVVVVAATAFSVLPQRPRAEYHALSQQPAYAAGNVIAIFSPDISEVRLRETLVANHARIVDGPTGAGAYVLRVPDSERARILVGLQNDEHVILAQQIGAGPSR